MIEQAAAGANAGRRGGDAERLGDAARRSLFRRHVVQRLAFVDDVDGEIFEGLVAHHFQPGVGNLTWIDVGRPGRQSDLLPIRSL